MPESQSQPEPQPDVSTQALVLLKEYSNIAGFNWTIQNPDGSVEIATTEAVFMRMNEIQRETFRLLGLGPSEFDSEDLDDEDED